MSTEQESEQPEERAPVLPAVRSSLAAARVAGSDRGAEALALRYAELLDEAAAADKYTKALRLVGEAVQSQADSMPLTAGDQLMSAWDRIASALAEHSVASDLGPKLLAALTALGLTPAGRATKPTAGGQPGGEVTPIRTPLQILRDEAKEQRRGSSTAS